MSNLTREDRLVLLIEECAEVIHAATKCLRFGFDANHDVNDYGRNDVVLACEIGDLLGVIDGLMPWLDPKDIDKHRTYKIERAEYAKQIYGVRPCTKPGCTLVRSSPCHVRNCGIQPIETESNAQ